MAKLGNLHNLNSEDNSYKLTRYALKKSYAHGQKYNLTCIYCSEKFASNSHSERFYGCRKGKCKTKFEKEDEARKSMNFQLMWKMEVKKTDSRHFRHAHLFNGKETICGIEKEHGGKYRVMDDQIINFFQGIPFCLTCKRRWIKHYATPEQLAMNYRKQ